MKPYCTGRGSHMRDLVLRSFSHSFIHPPSCHSEKLGGFSRCQKRCGTTLRFGDRASQNLLGDSEKFKILEVCNEELFAYSFTPKKNTSLARRKTHSLQPPSHRSSIKRRIQFSCYLNVFLTLKPKFRNPPIRNAFPKRSSLSSRGAGTMLARPGHSILRLFRDAPFIASCLCSLHRGSTWSKWLSTSTPSFVSTTGFADFPLLRKMVSQVPAA